MSDPSTAPGAGTRREGAVTAAAPQGDVGGESPPMDARGVWKSYEYGDGSELRVLQGVDLRIEAGEAVAIIGSSGAGKSTLLQILGALDHPDAGTVRIGGTSLEGIRGDALAALRNRNIGFVFQFHHLLREFSALENAMMPCLIAGRPEEEARERAREILEAVGLARRLDHRPRQLSGGEQQRVAVARALSNGPVLMLADEPSGNLDAHTSEQLHDLLFRLKEERGLALAVVTHNRELAERADRILVLRDGVLRESEER
jgi:lipoprotein-releasing system ATP-binding protein